MKTSRINKSYPNGKKIIPFVIAVASFCFLNSQVIQARDYSRRYVPTDNVTIMLTNENHSGAIFQVRSWDFDFHTMFISYIIRHKINQAQVRAEQLKRLEREKNYGPTLNSVRRGVRTRDL